MSDLIQSLGTSYFRDFFNTAIFLYQGKAHSVRDVDNRNVVALRLSDNEIVAIPNKEFMGFKAFAYPTLGYRRFADDTVGWLNRVQSAHRGLRARSISVDWSPTTLRLHAAGVLRNPTLYRDKAGLLAFEPQWDKTKDIIDLLHGQRANVVLNEALLIEPSTKASDEWYTIYYNQAVVGSMDYRGRCTFKTPRHERIVVPMLKAA